MAPKLTGIDHIHVYVDSRHDAEKWYETVFGFKRVEALMSWAIENGPLTIGNEERTIHLALFKSPGQSKSSAIAFGASGEEFLAWKKRLEGHGLELRVKDHRLAYSLYFTDPWNNLHEITTYEHDVVAKQLVSTVAD